MHFDLPERRMQSGDQLDANLVVSLVLPNLQRNNATSQRINSLMKLTSSFVQFILSHICLSPAFFDQKIFLNYYYSTVLN